MRRRFQGLVLVAAAVAAAGLAYAQSADLVLCDRVAADPSDPDKPADVKGVSDIAASDIATAIKYCRIAANSSRRAMYQLGRSYAANRQTPEAIAAWRKAADKGSTSAMVELGVLYEPAQVSQEMKRRRGNCSSVPPKPAIRAASAISQPSAAVPAHRQIRCVRAKCCQRAPRPMPRRSINSA